MLGKKEELAARFHAVTHAAVQITAHFKGNGRPPLLFSQEGSLSSTRRTIGYSEQSAVPYGML